MPAALVYRNAVLLANGVDASGQFNELRLEFSAEMQDATAFGDDTRRRKGGLKIYRITGTAFYEAGANKVDPTFFDNVGADNVVAVLFPDGVTEGETAKKGYAFKATQASFTPGGAVGDLLPVAVAIEAQEGTS